MEGAEGGGGGTDPDSTEPSVELENLGDGTEDRQPTKFRENAPGRISSRIIEAKQGKV